MPSNSGSSIVTKKKDQDEPKKESRLVFYPFAYALFTNELASYCWYCLKPDTKKKHCTGCGFALFCDKECQTLGWKDHKAECKGFRKAKSVPDIETRLLGRIVLRYKAIYNGKDKEDPDFYKDRSSNRQILDIWSHDKEMTKDPVAINKFEEIYQNLTEFYDSKFLLTKETIWQLHTRDYINRHAICNKGYIKEIGKGLYLDLCQYDHSCRPNSIYTCDGFIATLRGLSPNIDLCNTKTTNYAYIDLLNSIQQRRKLLRDTWYFNCECERCTDPKDHLLTAILCPNCPMGEQLVLCIFGSHPYKDPQTLKITCPKCKVVVPNEFVAYAIECMRSVDTIFDSDQFNKLRNRKEQLDYLNDTFDKYCSIFPPTNVFLGKLIQGLIERVTSNEDLLRLHLASEPCVRLCFPTNHPAVAFHVRNIAIFLSNLEYYEESIPYFKEAYDMMLFVLDEDHQLTVEIKELLDEATVKADKKKKKTENGSSQIEENMKNLNVKPPVVEHPEENKECKPLVQFNDNTDDLPELIED